MPKVHYLRENGIGKGTVEELQLGSLCMEVRQQYTRVTFLYFTVSRNVHFDLKYHFLQRCAPLLSIPRAAAHPDKTCTVQFQETQDQTSGQGGSMHFCFPCTGRPTLAIEAYREGDERHAPDTPDYTSGDGSNVRRMTSSSSRVPASRAPTIRT